MTRPQRRQRILIVDDEAPTRAMLSEMIAALGFDTGEATDSQEAVAAIRHEPYDVVLTDFWMPGMDGIELVREIKTMRPDLPVIVITGHSSVQTAVESIRAGAFDFVEKPVSLQALQVRVQRALEYANLVASSAEYKRRATVDALTGLYNFGYFQEHIERDIERGRRYKYPLSLLMVDMDHLKMYNDAHGHTAGNRVLMQLGELLRAHIRKADVACRFGGEEFAIILPHTGKKDAYLLCDRLRVLIEKTPFEGEDALPSGKLTVSSGVATFPDDADNAEDLVDRADRALYAAKRNGRNLVEMYNG